jgi:putative glutathione S-transferase
MLAGMGKLVDGVWMNIKRHYFTSHPHLNANGIVPVGPLIDLMAPHQRGRLAA